MFLGIDRIPHQAGEQKQQQLQVSCTLNVHPSPPPFVLQSSPSFFVSFILYSTAAASSSDGLNLHVLTKCTYQRWRSDREKDHVANFLHYVTMVLGLTFCHSPLIWCNLVVTH